MKVIAYQMIVNLVCVHFRTNQDMENILRLLELSSHSYSRRDAFLMLLSLIIVGLTDRKLHQFESISL